MPIIRKYKDEKMYSYSMCGFVDTVFVAGELTFLQSIVCPSDSVRGELITDCKVISSWCTCVAGTREVCNHVIALQSKFFI